MSSTIYTKLDELTLRWNAVPGATEYTVELISSNGVIWKAQLKGTQILFPGNPPLEPGVSYSLKIQANTGQSSEQDSASNLGFLPILYRTLGDFYWQSGLANLTAQNYFKALELAKSPEFLEERTLAQFGLGEVSAATDDNQQAITWYEQAKMGYVALGDTQRADFLNRRLKNLQSR